MKRTFSKDVYGFYVLPLLGWSRAPRDGLTVWFGIGPWLW